MALDPSHIVAKYYDGLLRGDLAAVLGCFAEGIELHLHVSPEVLAFAGSTSGLAAAEERYRSSFRDWDCERAEAVTIHGDDGVVDVDCRSAYRHKASGSLLEGRLRNRFVIVGGLIQRLDEWLDEAALEAFVEMARATMTARLRNHAATIH